MWAQKETSAKRSCPGVVLIWWELQCIPGHSHSVQLFLDLLQKLKKCCSLFHCMKTETAKISSAWTSLKKRSCYQAPKNIAYIWKQRLSPHGCKCCYQDNGCSGENTTLYCETTNPRRSLVKYQNKEVRVGRTGRTVGGKTRRALSCSQEKWSFLVDLRHAKTHFLKVSSLSS